MQIIRVSLENFRSYREGLVDFVPGVNAIVGANGAGKSTVLGAIGLALFNARPPSIHNEGLVREGANSATVTVEFESTLDERRYEVERRLGTNARFRVYDIEMGKAVVAEGVADVEGWLRQHLGVPADGSLSDLFENTIGVYQGTFTAPFLLPAAQRKGIFDPLLRVDEYKRASDQLREPIKLLRDEDRILSQNQGLNEGMISALPDLRSRRELLDASLAANRKALAAAHQALGEANERLDLFRAREAAAAQAQKARDLAHSVVEGTQQRLGDANTALLRARAASERIAATAPGHQRYVKAEQHRAQLEARRKGRELAQVELARVEESLAAERANVKRYRDGLERLADQGRRARQLEPLAQRQRDLQAALEEAQERVRQRQSAIERGDDLRRQIDDQHEQVKNLAAQVAEGQRLDAKRAMTQARLDALQHDAGQRQLLLGQLRAQQAQLRKQLTDLDAAEGAQCPLCEAPLTEEHRAELLERNGAAIAALEAELVALDSAAQESDSERSRLRADLDELDALRRTLAGPAQVQAAERLLSDLQHRALELQEQVAARGTPEEDVRQAQEALAALGDPEQELAICRRDLEQLPAAQEALEKGVAAVAALEAQQREAVAAVANFAGNDERLADVERTLEENRADYDAYVGSQNEAGQLEQSAQRVSELDQRLSEALAQLATAEADLATATRGFDPDQLARAHAEVLSGSQRVAALEATIAGEARSLEETITSIERLEAKERELEQITLERKRLADASAFIDWVRTHLTEAGPLVTQQLVRRISADAASLFSELMDNYSARLAWDESYALTLDVAGRERDFAQLSGGEQMCAALALRLALLRNLSGIDVAFFDEPTAHLDAERRALLAHTLTQVQGFEQIFVISHDSTFEQAAQANFEVTKDGNESRIARI